MSRYKPQQHNSLLLPVVLSEEIVPGSFGFARDYLVNHELDFKALDAPTSKPPMTAQHGLVTHGPHRAKHLHNFHQAQPLGEGVDPGSVAHLRLKSHARLARQHRTCIDTDQRLCRFRVNVIRGVHSAGPVCRTGQSSHAPHPCRAKRGVFSTVRECLPGRAFASHRSRSLAV